MSTRDLGVTCQHCLKVGLVPDVAPYYLGSLNRSPVYAWLHSLNCSQLWLAKWRRQGCPLDLEKAA